MAKSTGTSKTYSDYFKDPRWQKKRLEVMKRDDFTCRSCGDKESTLNVHHTYYEKGNKPWEYPLQSLITRCEKCHEYRHNLSRELLQSIGQLTKGQYEGLYSMLVLETSDEFLKALGTIFASPFYFNYDHLGKIAYYLASSYDVGMSDEQEHEDV
jgi:hypothetical protein